MPPRSNQSMIGRVSSVAAHAVEHRRDGAAHQLARDVFGALQLAFVFELDLAGERRQRAVDVADARDGRRFAVHERPPLGVRDDAFERRDRQPLADAGPLVDLLILARLERDLLDDLAHERGDFDRHARRTGGTCRTDARRPGFLRRDRHRVDARARVVGADLRPDPVLERRDDLAARRVVLGVGAEDHRQVQPQPHRVAFDLDVAFLKDVEQPDLDLAGEVRQFVDRKNPAIRAREQAVVHRQLVAELQAGPHRLDRVDVADHVGDRDVRRRQLLDVAVLARAPGDRQVVALGRHARPAGRSRWGRAGRRGSRSPGRPGSPRPADRRARAAAASSPDRGGRAG